MTFTNIQICNISDKLTYAQIEEKIIKFKENKGYKLVECQNDLKCSYIKILSNPNSKFITVFDSDFYFTDLKENKSYIRKLSKMLMLPVFCITNMENNHIIIEQYNFNKRIYDYLSIGNSHNNMQRLGYENKEYFNNLDIWCEFFVGRNNLNNLEEVIKSSKEYVDKSYIIEDIFRLYGLTSDMSLYNVNNENTNIICKTLYFTKIN